MALELRGGCRAPRAARRRRVRVRSRRRRAARVSPRCRRRAHECAPPASRPRVRIASASAIDAATCACFASRSRASMRTSGWPAATASPSCTSTSITVPMSFVLSVAWLKRLGDARSLERRLKRGVLHGEDRPRHAWRARPRARRAGWRAPGRHEEQRAARRDGDTRNHGHGVLEESGGAANAGTDGCGSAAGRGHGRRVVQRLEQCGGIESERAAAGRPPRQMVAPARLRERERALQSPRPARRAARPRWRDRPRTCAPTMRCASALCTAARSAIDEPGEGDLERRARLLDVEPRVRVRGFLLRGCGRRAPGGRGTSAELARAGEDGPRGHDADRPVAVAAVGAAGGVPVVAREGVEARQIGRARAERVGARGVEAARRPRARRRAAAASMRPVSRRPRRECGRRTAARRQRELLLRRALVAPEQHRELAARDRRRRPRPRRAARRCRPRAPRRAARRTS